MANLQVALAFAFACGSSHSPAASDASTDGDTPDAPIPCTPPTTCPSGTMCLQLLAGCINQAGGSADGTGSAARFNGPGAVAVDAAGNTYVADTFNDTIRKVTPAGVVTTLAGTALDPGGADGTGSAAQFNLPDGLSVDGSGNLYVADGSNDTIRKVTPAGVVTTIAGTTGDSGSTDGLGTDARFFAPAGLALDGSGNLYVADLGNYTIRTISPAGAVATLAGSAGRTGSADGTGSAARFEGPAGVAVDSAGNVYVADLASIRKITSGGTVSTLAGSIVPGSADGTGSAAEFDEPTGVAVDGSGNVYVADSLNHTVRRVTPAGVVTTVAGMARSQGGIELGTSPRFGFPEDLAVSGDSLVIVDGGLAPPSNAVLVLEHGVD